MCRESDDDTERSSSQGFWAVFAGLIGDVAMGDAAGGSNWRAAEELNRASAPLASQ